jgi:hypothetical protein
VIRDPPSLFVVKYLALTSPEVVALEDREETSALEFSIISDADVEVVKFLMRQTQIQVSGEPSRSCSFLGLGAVKNHSEDAMASMIQNKSLPEMNIDEVSMEST